MVFAEVIKFWFEELGESAWYKASDATDQLIRDRFETQLLRAVAGEFYDWRSHPEGALAEIILLGQFSRNIYRGTPRAFGQDAQALALAQWAVSRGYDKVLEPRKRVFFYMPYMHSESAAIHQTAVALFNGLPNLDYELAHKRIIDRFGRYPHRNKILGRQSSQEELAFLSEPGSHF